MPQDPVSDAQPATRGSAAGRFRILTANLWNGKADPGAFARSVQEHRVDVAAVQELGEEQARALERALDHGKLEPARNYRGMGIALRRPASIRRLALAERDAWIARLDPADWPGLPAPVEIVNVHIFSPTHRPVRRAFPVRREQLRGLEAYLAEAERIPRALVGDLNSTRIWPVYRRIAQRLEDAVDLWARGAPGRWPRRTWGPAPWSPRLFRIDHVFVRGLAVHHLEVIRISGSDHSAVLCEVGVAQPRPEPA